MDRWTVNGRPCVITGANSGIGRVTALELARLGAHVIFACRSESRTRPVMEQISAVTGNRNLGFVQLDLASLASVRQAAQVILDRGEPLPLLINNAGYAGFTGLTVDGFEIHFGVNHLGHFLFTNLLLPQIQASAPARIITVSSLAHKRVYRRVKFDQVLRKTWPPIGLPQYAISKLANVLFSVELARRLEGTGVSTYVLHPGVVASHIWRQIPWPLGAAMKLFMISNEEGAQTTLYCATSLQVAEQTGLYYERCQVDSPSPLSQDRELARELWDLSLQLTAGSPHG